MDYFRSSSELTDVLPWPIPTPDLSLIEDVWDIICKGWVCHRWQQLSIAEQIAWDELPQKTTDHLIRVTECIQLRRALILYCLNWIISNQNVIIYQIRLNNILYKCFLWSEIINAFEIEQFIIGINRNAR